MTQMKKLVYMQIKMITISVFHMFKKLEEWLNIVSTDVENTKTFHIKLPMIKNNTMSDMKNILVGINNGLDIA